MTDERGILFFRLKTGMKEENIIGSHQLTISNRSVYLLSINPLRSIQCKDNIGAVGGSVGWELTNWRLKVVLCSSGVRRKRREPLRASRKNRQKQRSRNRIVPATMEMRIKRSDFAGEDEGRRLKRSE